MKKYKVFWNDLTEQLQEVTVLAADCFLAKILTFRSMEYLKRAFTG
jgi:hypothetical protein